MVEGSRPTAAQCSFRISILVPKLGDRRRNVPVVGVARHRPQGLLLAAPADHDRHVLPNRNRMVLEVLERVVTAGLRSDDLAIQESADRPGGLVEPGEALADRRSEVDAVGEVLVPEPGRAKPGDRPAVADVVECRHGLGDEPGIAERVRPDEEAEVDLLRCGGPRSEHRVALEDRLEPLADDGVKVIPGPEMVVAESVHSLRGVEHLRPGGGLTGEHGAEAEVGHRGGAPGGMWADPVSPGAGIGARVPAGRCLGPRRLTSSRNGGCHTGRRQIVIDRGRPR